MIPIKLVFIWLMLMQGRQMYKHGGHQTQRFAQAPTYPKKDYDRALEHNPHQDMNNIPLKNFERFKRSAYFGDREVYNEKRIPLLSQDSTTILKSYDRKRIRRSSLENDNPNNANSNLVNANSPKISENSSSKPLEETPFIQTTSSLHFFWNANETKESIREARARKMRNYMDTSVEPCDDFYKYACGNWDKHHPIPKDAKNTDILEIMRDNLNNVLRELLEGYPLETTYLLQKPDDHIGKNRKDISKTPDEDYQETENKRLNQQLTREPQSSGEVLSRFRRIALINNTIQNSFCTNQTTEVHYSAEHCKNMQELTIPTSFIATAKQSGAGVNSDDAERKAKILYESCANLAQRKQRGIQPLLDFIDGLGGWPVLSDNWSSKNFDWLNLTALIRRYENGILISQTVDPDFRNSDRNIIHFGQTTLGLPTRADYLQDENVKRVDAYQRFVSGVINKFGASKAKSAKAAADLVRFEAQLASITTDAGNNWLTDTKSHKRMTLSHLRVLIPQIDWIRYLSVLQQRSVNESEQVIMHSTEYMSDLVNLLNHTDPVIVANYLFWRFAQLRLKNLDGRFNGITQTFYREIFGQEENPPPWKLCINQVNTAFSMAVGSMFVRKYFDENSKNDILDMTGKIKQVFRENLMKIDWLDADTKHLAELKVDAMCSKIGYPDFILNSDRLNAEYSDLKLNPDKYFESTLNILLHKTRTMQSKLYQPVDKTTWDIQPTTVNAVHDPLKNTMEFPAGILQSPFYHRHYPRALNYGAIGQVIGHELTHGFDDTGRLFDRYGNINDWWTNSSIEGFEKRVQCIIEQYGNYTLEEVGDAVNGDKTKGENIADNGGIKVAYQAYKKWLHDSPEAALDNQLPGINMTGEQLFFLSFGQSFCSTSRNEIVRTTLITDAHTPGRFRVIGTLSNSKDFSKAFKCPLGSPMNPAHKCSVW